MSKGKEPGLPKAKPKAKPKDAVEQIAEAAEHPTLDVLMRRDPAKLGKGDLTRMVELSRKDRVTFLEKESQKVAKKEGVEE